VPGALVCVGAGSGCASAAVGAVEAADCTRRTSATATEGTLSFGSRSFSSLPSRSFEPSRRTREIDPQHAFRSGGLSVSNLKCSRPPAFTAIGLDAASSGRTAPRSKAALQLPHWPGAASRVWRDHAVWVGIFEHQTARNTGAITERGAKAVGCPGSELVAQVSVPTPQRCAARVSRMPVASVSGLGSRWGVRRTAFSMRLCDRQLCPCDGRSSVKK
jgi:hypothetical protein